MGKLINVVGNSGVGKSTLTKHLCRKGGFTPILEEMEKRPFIWKFHDNRARYAVPNQVDYFLYAAEKEHAIRAGDTVGVEDSGLEFGFHVFTKRFHQKGYLNTDEYHLCERLYRTIRNFLPPPDLIIYLHAPLSIIKERMQHRGRELDIEKEEDLVALDILMNEWLVSLKDTPVITVDAENADAQFSAVIDHLIVQINSAFDSGN